MTEDELELLKKQAKDDRKRAKDDRKLIEQAAQALAEIDRGVGLTDQQADVLTALRIRLEGKARASLDDLIQVTGDIGGKKDLGEVLSTPADQSDWPSEVKETKRDWPGT